MNKSPKIEIPDFLKKKTSDIQENLGIQKKSNVVDKYNYKVPVFARIIALLCAFIIILICFIYVYKLFRVSDSMYEENVNLILQNKIDKDQVIISYEPGYSVVKITGKETKYYIFDNKNNLIYPDIVRKDIIDELREKNNERVSKK